MAQLMVTVKGIQLPVDVSGDGTFSTRYQSEYLRDKTLEGLKIQLRKAVQNSGVTVPFTIVKGSDILHGDATGIHASSGQTLVRYLSGGTEQLREYTSGILHRLSDGETSELTALIEARNRAAQAVEEFQKSRVMFLAKAVKEALASAAGDDKS